MKRFEKRGKPRASDAYTVEWQITSEALVDQSFVDQVLDKRSCFIVATNISQEVLPTPLVLAEYKDQDYTEKGFAFLKSPDFFTSSLFLKKTGRIDALLMIMVLSLLVYTIAQRRLRSQLALLKLTVPNQINKAINNPTLRWIFQIFEGIHYVITRINGVIFREIEGLTDLRKRIIQLLGPDVQAVYQNFS